MTDQKFPFLRLPDNLRSKVSQTTEYLEIIAYSFLSKKSYSMVKALRLPILNVMITMKKQPQIEVTLSFISIKFELNMPENDEKITHLNGFPVDVKVTYLNFENYEFNEKITTWTNQGKTVGEWIQHLCSLNQPKNCYVTDFYVREIELDVQTFHNTFPKPFSVNIIFHQAEADENDIMSAQNVLKAFQLVSQYFRFERFPFQHHLSLQHIGMENSKILVLRYPRNLRIDDFLTLNAKSILLETDQVPLRDLNRFFKLWMKGSNPKLQELRVFWRTEINPDWNVLLKGLTAGTKKRLRKKKLKIKNCRRVCGKIRCEWWRDSNYFRVEFTVPK